MAGGEQNRIRKLMKLAFLLLVGSVLFPGNLFARGDKPITSIRFDADYSQITNSAGDEWAPTWADDGNLYTGNDDGSSFGGIPSRSVAFGKLVGDDPNNLKGITVSDFGEYGGEPARPDKGNWKTMNSYCVD